MLFRFTIEYHTQWGEDLRLQAEGKEYQMNTLDGIIWSCDINIPVKPGIFTYNYALYRNGQFVWKEWENGAHTLHIPPEPKSKKKGAINMQTYFVEDFWRPIPADLPLYSSAYTDVVASHEQKSLADLNYYTTTLQLRVVEPRLRKKQRLAICGNAQILGNWEKPVEMQMTGLQEWTLNIDTNNIFHPLEYKYVIIDENGDITAWEEGTNRFIDKILINGNFQTWVKNERQPRFNFQNWKCAGVVIPVFSLRTEQSYGVGDFADLKQMISWAASVGMHVVQILPINDTMMSGKWQDSYPYNAISIYAFHPLYADINALPKLKDKLKMETFKIRQQELNRDPFMDYEQAIAVKMEYFRLAYEQEWEKVAESNEFKRFFEANKTWLVPYAAFSYLRDTYQTPDFRAWPKHQTFSKSDISRLCSQKSTHYKGVALYYYIQYQLHLQLTDVHQHAKDNGVIIKGDIPIGISKNSVEAWSEPHLFNMDEQAGAPPDAFSTNGQNWGFPTYNWAEMAKDGYSWWKRRFTKMAEYFDAYRIDHVLGFFRIWEIPEHSVHGLLGHFAPALPLSQSEIEGYGMHFNRKLMTQPFINDDILYQMFDYKADMVKMIYLENAGNMGGEHAFNAFGGVNGLYKLKAEYDTQRKIQAAFAGKDDEDSIALRDGLYELVSNVLFVIDNDNPHGYHPRISAIDDKAFQYLSDSDKHAFRRLYEDYFYHRHNDFWYHEAMKKLPMLTQCTRMLVCAEDLGMVPACVPTLMDNLKILSLEIQSMPKAFGVEFGKLSENPYLSVATISTHDMSTLRQWWEEDHDRSQRYYNNSLHIDGQAPEVLPGWLAEKIVARHLYSPSMLCLLSLQDWLAIDEQVRNPDANGERINIPSNPRHYWRWRMHINVSDLQNNQDLSSHIRELIDHAGRL